MSIEYVWGQDRNDPNATAHCYEGPFNDIVGPLCMYGWNRSNGERFSILRNVVTGPRCKICFKREKQGKRYVEPREHKTRWI